MVESNNIGVILFKQHMSKYKSILALLLFVFLGNTMSASINFLLEKSPIEQVSYENSDLEKDSQNKKEKSEEDEKEEKYLSHARTNIVLSNFCMVYKSVSFNLPQVFIGIIATPPELI
jgi:hypothetical protein